MPAKLSQLDPGKKGTIVSVQFNSEFKKRLAEMGIIAGVVIEVERVAPLGDPLDVKVKGCHLSIRKEDAVGITVETI